jgi:1,4-alpha-glucan branching enzyme
MAKPQLVKEPKKSAEKTITLKAKVGEAREVILTGDFTGWSKDKVRLTKGTNGEWTGVVNLTPGEYQYRLLVDGEWRDDPAAATRVPNTFGSSNCVLQVS